MAVSPNAKRALALVLLVAILCGGGGALLLFRSPSPPVFEGRSLKEWQRDWLKDRISNAEMDRVVHALGAESVPWLAWTAEHGHGPRRESSARLSKWIEEIIRRINPNYESADVPYFNERTASMWSLWELGPAAAPAISALSNCLDPREDVSIRTEAVKVLARLLPQSLPVLADTAKDPSFEVRTEVQEAFCVMDLPASDAEKDIIFGLILNGLTDSDSLVRGRAAVSAGFGRSYLPPERFKALIDQLALLLADQEHEDVLETACLALGQFGEHAVKVRPQALQLLGSPVALAKCSGAQLLGDIDGREQLSREALVLMTSDPIPQCRVAAAKALGQFGIRSDSVIDECLVELRSDDVGSQSTGIARLREIGPIAADTLPAIFEVMKADPNSFSDALEYLPEFGEEVCIPYLLEALANPAPPFRANAARVFAQQLRNVKSPEVAAALRKVAEDDSVESVRMAAKQALEN